MNCFELNFSSRFCPLLWGSGHKEKNELKKKSLVISEDSYKA